MCMMSLDGKNRFFSWKICAPAFAQTPGIANLLFQIILVALMKIRQRRICQLHRNVESSHCVIEPYWTISLLLSGTSNHGRVWVVVMPSSFWTHWRPAITPPPTAVTSTSPWPRLAAAAVGEGVVKKMTIMSKEARSRTRAWLELMPWIFYKIVDWWVGGIRTTWLVVNRKLRL